MYVRGVLLSVAAAFFWALAVVLFKKSGRLVSPMALNLLKCIIALMLYLPTLALLDMDIFKSVMEADWILFGISGFLGIALADTFFFMALSELEAGVLSIVECMYLPFVIILSYIFLDETLGWAGICGAGLVLWAVVLGSSIQFKKSFQMLEFNRGVIWGMVAVFLIAVSLIMIKDEMARTNVFLASFIRIVGGIIGLFVMAGLRKDRRKIFKELRPAPIWKSVIPASVCGNYLAVLMWLAGIKYIYVSVASILNQLSTVFVFLLSVMFLQERVTLRKLIAIGCAISGAALAAVSQ